MTINELVCKPDGTQEIISREVPDDFFDISAPPPTAEERISALETLVLELGGVI